MSFSFNDHHYAAALPGPVVVTSSSALHQHQILAAQHAQVEAPKCSLCRAPGHNKTVCPQRPKDASGKSIEPPKKKIRHSDFWLNEESRLHGCHWPSTKLRSNSARLARGLCKVCNTKSTVRCMNCDEFLHVDDEREDNCFFRFHNLKNFKKV